LTYVELSFKFTKAGSFFIQIGFGEPDHIRFTKPNYINVEPQLFLNTSTTLRCKQINMISVLSRCLGPLSRWEDVLKPVAAQGYNMVHFTPIQRYGQSRSHYSLADQTVIDDFFFAPSDQATSA
jgi:glycogen debranching enzyme